MSEIKPALTPEEWAAETTDSLSDRVQWACGEIGAEDAVSRHALAALALHRQPFGFDPRTAQALDAILSDAILSSDNEHFDHADYPLLRGMNWNDIRAIAWRAVDVIAALLPPQP